MHISVQVHMSQSLGDVQELKVSWRCRTVQTSGWAFSPVDFGVSDSVNPVYTKHYSVPRCCKTMGAEL